MTRLLFPESTITSSRPVKWTFIKLLLISLPLILFYLFLTGNISPTNTRNFMEFSSQLNEVKPRAYLISSACNSLRFNVTKANIERVFPKFFNIICHTTIPLTDPRISTSPVLVQKKFSSNLLSFFELWTYKIPKNSKSEYEWSFIFEDDVNFNSPAKVNLTNFISPVQTMMNHPEVQKQDGFFYLGLCDPIYSNVSRPIIMNNTLDTLRSEKGFGYCLHASAITTKRSRLFWTGISSYRPNPSDASLDFQLRTYCHRSGTFFYVLGTNFHFPPKTAHYGIAYQDRGLFETTVGENE